MAFNIAIDGPAGAGKSTIAKKLAADLHSCRIDQHGYLSILLCRLNQSENGDARRQVHLHRKHIKSGTVHRIGHGLRILHPLVTNYNLHSISHPPSYRHTDLSGTRKQHYLFFHITHF